MGNNLKAIYPADSYRIRDNIISPKNKEIDDLESQLKEAEMKAKDAENLLKQGKIYPKQMPKKSKKCTKILRKM